MEKDAVRLFAPSSIEMDAVKYHHALNTEIGLPGNLSYSFSIFWLSLQKIKNIYPYLIL